MDSLYRLSAIGYRVLRVRHTPALGATMGHIVLRCVAWLFAVCLWEKVGSTIVRGEAEGVAAPRVAASTADDQYHAPVGHRSPLRRGGGGAGAASAPS